MLEQVEQKIQELKKIQAEEYYKKKDSDLNAWGLTTKRNGKKTTPIIVTDDEYEALIKASNGVGKSGRNSVANTLKACSVASVLVSIVAGATVWYTAKEMGFIWFSVAILAGVVIALIFHGLSEAIRLLQQLIDMEPLKKPDPIHAQVNVPVQQPVMTAQYMAAQPPIYQASSYRQTAQPYYGVPVPPAPPAQPMQPAAPVQNNAEPPAYGAPQNYTEMGTFEREVQDDFFSSAPYNPETNFTE